MRTEGMTVTITTNGRLQGKRTANGGSAGQKNIKLETGSGLTLQIGDTAKDYNKLSVDVKDMHTKNLGISDVDISTQSGAATAIDKIKDAINTVSPPPAVIWVPFRTVWSTPRTTSAS